MRPFLLQFFSEYVKNVGLLCAEELPEVVIGDRLNGLFAIVRTDYPGKIYLSRPSEEFAPATGDFRTGIIERLIE